MSDPAPEVLSRIPHTTVWDSTRNAVDGLGARWRSSGLWDEALVLLAAMLASVVIFFVVADRFWAQTRLETLLLFESAQINALGNAVERLPKERRAAFLESLERATAGALRRGEAPTFERPIGIRARLMEGLSRLVPEGTVGYTGGGVPKLWFSVPGENDAHRQWLYIGQPSSTDGWTEFATFLVIALATFCIPVAAWLVWGLRRSLPGPQANAQRRGDADLETARRLLRDVVGGEAVGHAGAATTGRFAGLVQQVRTVADACFRRAWKTAPQVRMTSTRSVLRFASDVLLVLLMMLSALALVVSATERTILMPRSATAAGLFAKHVRVVVESVALLPPDLADAFLRDAQQHSRGMLARATISGVTFERSRIPSTAYFVDLVSEMLSPIPTRSTVQGNAAFWFMLPAREGVSPQWIRYAAPQVHRGVLFAIGALFLLALAWSVLIVWRAHKRIRHARTALHRLEAEGLVSRWRMRDAGDAGPVTRHPLVREALLREEHDHGGRAIALAVFAAELRSAMQRWRERRPAGVDGRTLAEGLVSLEDSLADIDEFRRAAASDRELVDCNDLLEELQAECACEVELRLGGIPFVSMQRAQAWRVLQAMAGHVQAAGCDRLVVQSALQGGWVLVRVSGESAAPPRRRPHAIEQTDAALELQVALHIAQAHGAKVSASSAGPPWIELRLHPARVSAA